MHVIAIDLDGTALKYPEKVNALFEQKQNLIVLYTARSDSIREETEKEIHAKQIKYHALVMQKLRADCYIDDRNCGGLQWPDC